MTKIIECKNTKAELEGYIECLIDQLFLLSRKYTKTTFIHKDYILKAGLYFRVITQHSSSIRIINKAISYYEKIIHNCTLLSKGIYKEDEDNG